VKFADDSTLVLEGVGVVAIKGKNGKQSLIIDVLYIPDMKCNLLSIGQLLDRDYKITIEEKMLRIMDSHKRLIVTS
jgi:hypothetical protein